MRGERLVFFITAAAWLVLDLGTKQFMQDLLGRVGSVLWFDGFRFVLVYNHGAAFGFLSSAGGWNEGSLSSLPRWSRFIWCGVCG